MLIPYLILVTVWAFLKKILIKKIVRYLSNRQCCNHKHITMFSVSLLDKHLQYRLYYYIQYIK